MPKSTEKTKNLKPNQITELLNDSYSGDDVLGALDGDSDEEVEDIRGFTEDVGDEDVRFYNCDPPETTPGSEVLSWLASAPSRSESSYSSSSSTEWVLDFLLLLQFCVLFFSCVKLPRLSF